jgi:hypothetical protein
VKEVLD